MKNVLSEETEVRDTMATESNLQIIPVPHHLPDDHLALQNGWLSVHARWASHTGYFSLGNRRDWSESASWDETSLALHQKALALPFLVGPWDAEGWSVIGKSYSSGLIQFRVPGWTEDVLKESLRQAVGAFETCSVNCYWSFPAGTTLPQARELLAPLLARGTRLTDQSELALQLRRSEAVIAHSFISAQIGLFD